MSELQIRPLRSPLFPIIKGQSDAAALCAGNADSGHGHVLLPDERAGLHAGVPGPRSPGWLPRLPGRRAALPLALCWASFFMLGFLSLA